MTRENCALWLQLNGLIETENSEKNPSTAKRSGDKKETIHQVEVTDVGSTLSNQVETISEKIMYFLELFIKREGSSTKSLV